MLRRTLPLLFAFAVAACGGHNNGSPTAPGGSIVYGTLAGVVTIGPNCPVEQANNPCPTPPDAYAARKVLVYDAEHAQVLNTVDINSQGLYAISLAPGNYVVDLKKVGIDRSGDVPKPITITANTTTRVDISIDTGIR